MDLFALILSCAISANSLALTVTHQIASSVEGDPLRIEDLTEAVVYTPPTHREATKVVTALLEAGHDVRVGLTQLNARRAWREYGLTPEAMLNSCTNVSVGSDLLSRELSKASPRVALATYLVGSPSDPVGLYWADRILEQDSVDLSAAAFDVEHTHPSRVYEEPRRALFVHRDANDKEAVPVTPRRRKAQRLFAVEPSSEQAAPEPEKWDSKTSKTSGSKKSKATSSSTSSPTTSRRTAAKRSKKRHQAQPDVTDEKLPTTQDLEAGGTP